MICPECGKAFTPQTVTQKYCSRACGDKYRYKTGGAHRPSITFTCAQCGKNVVTEGGSDMRTRFCCQSCEKKFWRHPHWETPYTNCTFSSVDRYLSYERKTNGD